jgi:hypothetical protein
MINSFSGKHIFRMSGNNRKYSDQPWNLNQGKK